MSVFIMLIAINGLAGFALGLVGRTRVVMIALPVSIFFSGTMLWFFGVTASQTVLKTIVCMFVGQATFLAASAFVFFSATNGASAEASSKESTPHKRWAKKEARKIP